MCGWYEIDPGTGSLVRWVEKGETPSPDKHYLVDVCGPQFLYHVL